MFVKKYLLIDQSMRKILASSKCSYHAFIQWVIEEYTESHGSKNRILFGFLKYFFLTVLITLSIFSFYKNFNNPGVLALREHTMNCIISEKSHCFGEFDYDKYSESDVQFRSEAYHSWIFYTNILIIILSITYLPYKLLSIYRFYRWGDISLFVWIWRAIKVLSIVFILPSLTWWFWAFLWSLSMYIYSSVATIPYELFGTFDIPWQI